MKNSSILLSVFALTTLFAFPLSATNQGAQGWSVYAGGFDVADEPVSELGVEFRLRTIQIKGVEFVPAFGIADAADNAFWAYGSLRYDWKLSNRLVATPQVGVSFFVGGDGGADLGGPIEFRSGLEVSYLLPRKARVGLLFYHLSNAGIYERNPGSNSLVLIWGFDR